MLNKKKWKKSGVTEWEKNAVDTLHFMTFWLTKSFIGMFYH